MRSPFWGPVSCFTLARQNLNGIQHLFYRSGRYGRSKLKWLNVQNISQLKMMLIEVIIVILFVFFLKYTLLHFAGATWKMLILPISILLLSMSLYILKKQG
ncbi:MAG: YqhA family protein [Gammaproteobacteria bacterium]|nr:YqhA family protein [Gammaproteobacteria bacterium]